MLKIIKKFVLDTLFPVSCLSCDQSNIWLCQKCSRKIANLSAQVCPYCEKIDTPIGAICPKCKLKSLKREASFPLDNLIVATSYTQNNIAHLVHTFKYNFVSDLGFPLSELMRKALLDNHLPLPDFILGVPLHPRRLRWRGFNQAEILARHLSTSLSPGLPIPIINNLIIRKKFTQPQMKIKNYQTRKNNMQNSFSLSDSSLKEKESVRNKKILLVDDISTTGSTMMECAKVLKNAGAEKVYGAVIARQEMK
jgi:competence protein ComFC